MIGFGALNWVTNGGYEAERSRVEYTSYSLQIIQEKICYYSDCNRSATVNPDFWCFLTACLCLFLSINDYLGLPRDFHTGPAVFSKTKRRYDTRLWMNEWIKFYCKTVQYYNDSLWPITPKYYLIRFRYVYWQPQPLCWSVKINTLQVIRLFILGLHNKESLRAFQFCKFRKPVEIAPNILRGEKNKAWSSTVGLCSSTIEDFCQQGGWMDDANEVLALSFIYQQIVCESLRITWCDYVITTAYDIFLSVFLLAMHHISDNMYCAHRTVCYIVRELFICQ